MFPRPKSEKVHCISSRSPQHVFFDVRCEHDCRVLFQCESSLLTSSLTSCTCRTTPPPYLEPAWHSASGFSPPRRKSCWTTTRLRSVTSFTRSDKTMQRFFFFPAFFPPLTKTCVCVRYCAGHGRREEGLRPSRAEVLPARETGRAEEDVHGLSLSVINKLTDEWPSYCWSLARLASLAPFSQPPAHFAFTADDATHWKVSAGVMRASETQLSRLTEAQLLCTLK